MKKIAFHSNQLSIRGTEVALYNYAKYNEDILGNKSVIFSHPNSDLSALKKFEDRFEVKLLNWYQYEKYLLDNDFDYLYIIKMGTNDGYCFKTIKTLVHSVFRFNDPHGYKYFYVSDWLAKHQGYDPSTHSLPHICEPLPEVNYNLRDKYDIPQNATVFGGYGGSKQFNIDFVKRAIEDVVKQYENIYFMFMNFDKFTDHPNVLFLPSTYDLNEKSSFVNSCDAMIHARSGGETFGLSISEFALENKPIITYGESVERAHIEIMGERAITYKNYEDVIDIFKDLSKYKKYDDYSLPYKQFSPKIIMDKFNKVFLT